MLIQRRFYTRRDEKKDPTFGTNFAVINFHGITSKVRKSNMSVLVFIIKILFKGKLFQLRNHDKTCNTIPSNTIQRTKNMAICIVCLILAILFSSLVSALNVFSCNFRRIVSTLANIKGKAIRPNRIQRPKVVRTLFIFNLS